MKKPTECCDVGSYDHQVPTAIKGRRCDIDLCVADIVAALNAANITTDASCCGHGGAVGDAIITTEDGRVLTIQSEEKWRKNGGWRAKTNTAGE